MSFLSKGSLCTVGYLLELNVVGTIRNTSGIRTNDIGSIVILKIGVYHS